jgi:hypothetical protein
MFRLQAKYWLPRIFVLVFVLSVFLPAPQFVSRMDDGTFLIWVARVIWVVSLPAVACLLLLIILGLKRKIEG